jgi:hypothetical protein
MKQFRDTPYFVTEHGDVYRGGEKKKLYKSNKGYNIVDFCVNGIRTKHNLHRVVAELYVENHEQKCCVNHIDGNKLNNHFLNLEWVSMKENSQHSVQVLKKEVAENHSRARIPNSVVAEIKTGILTEKNFPDIAIKYNVRVQHLRHIKNGHKRKYG